jgi:hypothetical protein
MFWTCLPDLLATGRKCPIYLFLLPLSRGQPDHCALSYGKHATYLLLDGSLLVLQCVSVADYYCHGHRNAGQGFALMLLCVLACEIWDETDDTRLFST